MAALMWTLAWLPQVLPALSDVPGPINLKISSARFNHTLTWEPGPGTPSGVHYRVFFQTQWGTDWLPVAGCEHVQHPLVCDLTLVFSNPYEGYMTLVTALQEERVLGSDSHETFEPIRDTIPDNPRLKVTPCGKDLCVDLEPPVDNLRKIYDDLKYKLKIQSANVAYEQDIALQEKKVLDGLVPGREYCVSVCFLDSALCRKSNYSRPICRSTRATINSDTLISTLLCVVVLAAVFVVGLLVYTNFLCPRGRPLPSILTSITHININLLVNRPWQTSLLNVRATAPSTGRKSPDSSDDEGVTNPLSVRNYKLWVGTNLSSANQNSNLATSSESDCPADALTGGGSQIKEEKAEVEVDSQNINLLTLTSGAHREGEEEVEEKEEEEGEGEGEEEEKSPVALQDVDLFTLKFGTHRREEVEQEEKSEDESPSAPNLPEQTVRGEGAESQTVSCSEDENEDEEELTYIVRFCAHHRR